VDKDENMRVKSPHMSKVVTLREGHFFGEMALVTVKKIFIYYKF
jgi:hypothetical protein